MAQLGRRLAEKVIDEHSADAVAELGGIDPDVVEAACLAHDTGHPPFGHAAEDELDRILIATGVTEGFEGNAQSLRVVTTLEPYRPDFLGLNLSRATVNALLKYPWTRLNRPSGETKWGVYESDASALSWARSGLVVPSSRAAEADIMDLADDIAYCVHDLHDFFRCRLTPLDQLWHGEAEFESFWRKAFQRWSSVPDLLRKHAVSSLRERFLTFLRSHLRVPQQYGGTHLERAFLREMTSSLIKRFRDGMLVTPIGGPLRIVVAEERAIEIRLLREITRVYVHRQPALLAQQVAHRRVVSLLFEVFRTHVDRGELDILPPHYRDVLEDEARVRAFCGAEAAPHLRLIADSICSLTDRQAFALYHRLVGIAPGYIADETTP
jgi:dGTPase